MPFVVIMEWTVPTSSDVYTATTRYISKVSIFRCDISTYIYKKFLKQDILHFSS
jgi:hypothetical protein